MNCKYHPAASASWHCPKCDTDLCLNCVPAGDASPKCAVCRSYLRRLGISQSIDPFWKNWKTIILKPFSVSLFVFLILLGWVCSSLFSSNWDLLNFLGGLVFWFAIFKLGISNLFYFAKGRFNSPKLGDLISKSNFNLAIEGAISIGILAFLLIKSHETSILLGLLAGSIFSLSTPAILISIVIDRSVFYALNPFRWWYIISAIGKDYWFGIVIFLLVQTSVVWLGLHLNSFSYIYQLVGLVIISMLTLINFGFIGYLIYQYHFELDFSIDQKTFSENTIRHQRRESKKQEKQANNKVQIAASDNPAIADAQVLIQEGRYDAAEQRLIEGVKSFPEKHETYFLLGKLLRLRNKKELLEKLIRKQLQRLSEKQDQVLTRKVFEEFADVINAFVESDKGIPADALELAIRSAITEKNKKNTKLFFEYVKKDKKLYNRTSLTLLVAKHLLNTFEDKEGTLQVVRWGSTHLSSDGKQAVLNFQKLI